MQTKILWEMVNDLPKPVPGSALWVLDQDIAEHRASVWIKQFINAGIEHLMGWADAIAPEGSDDRTEVVIRLRPFYVNSRASLESASQGAYILAAPNAKLMRLRHLQTVYSDMLQQKKFESTATVMPIIEKRAASVLQEFEERYAKDFEWSKLKNGLNLIDCIKSSSQFIGGNPSLFESVWRYSSGIAHGFRWSATANVEITDDFDKSELELEQALFPRMDTMTLALGNAVKMCLGAIYTYLDKCNIDPWLQYNKATHNYRREMPIKPGMEEQHAALMAQEERDLNAPIDYGDGEFMNLLPAFVNPPWDNPLLSQLLGDRANFGGAGG